MWNKHTARGLAVATLAALAAAALTAAPAQASETIAYRYDARGRLVQAAHSGTPAVNNNVTTSYVYDKADNRTSKSTTGSSNPPPP